MYLSVVCTRLLESGVPRNPVVLGQIEELVRVTPFRELFERSREDGTLVRSFIGLEAHPDENSGKV